MARSMTRSMTPIAAALAMTIVGVQTACARRSSAAAAPGRELLVPAGLDSAQVQAWIARQRASCHGHFLMLADVSVFAVQCVPDSTTKRNSLNER